MSPAAAVEASRQNPSSDASLGFDLGGIHAQSGFAGGTESRRPERARPRLVKVRKQVGFQDPRARSRASEAVGNGDFVFGADRRGVAEGSAKVGNLGFVFGAKENNPESNIELNPGKIDSNLGSFSFSSRNSCSAKDDGFVFKANQSGLASNLSSGFRFGGAGEKIGHENSVKTSSCLDFKLGACRLNTESNAKSEKSGDLGNSNNNLGPDLGFRFNSNGESADCSGSFSSTSSEFKLPDELRKLQINESDDSNTNSGGLHKASDFSSKNTESNTERINLNLAGNCSENGVSGISGSEPFTFQANPSHNCHNTESNEVSLGQDESGVSSMGFGTPLCDLSSLKESLFPEMNMSTKDKRVKETKRKPKKSVMKQHCNKEDANTPGCYSPMDFSPYQEITVTDQCPKEASVDSEKPEIIQTLFPCSSVVDDKTTGFNFSAIPSEEGKPSVRRHRFRRKSRNEVGHETFVINPSTKVRCEVDQSKPDPQFKQDHSSPSANSHEVCESWRFRGNQAYKTGEFSKAEAHYTQGIMSVPSNERTGPCLEPLLLCYSNRAAARMHLHRVREALGDCVMAALLDPNFTKVLLRAANCHLMLGEIEDALQYFSRCMEKASGVCLDRRIVLDAADGQQKAQKVTECINRSAKLLEEKTPDAALSALDIISEALLICSHSEQLLKLKAEALIVLRRHDEAIQLCEQSLIFAEKNFKEGSANGQNVRLWRLNLISKSYFHLGKFEAALALLDKLKQIEVNQSESGRKDIESSTLLSATIRNLLQHKNAGNDAFKSGKYSEAVECYTLALSTNFESRKFAAICFCNRAAAHQALNQIVDAIADCSLAMALDGNYAKAVSRRAVLHETIRDYGQAASDLQRVIAILESQPSDNVNDSGKSSKSTGRVKELRQAQMRLPVMEEEAKKGISLNFYLILDSKQTDTSADIKKAYRKAALKHHPDKAGQFLTRSESGNEGRVWKEIAQEVNKDADRLFKMIGEAYAVLSDSSKRSQHDIDEELRNATKACNGNSPSRASRRYSDAHTSTSRSSGFGNPNFEEFFSGRSSYRRSYRDYNWRTYY